MKKWRIEFTKEYRPSPLSFWVHKHLDGDAWPHATLYEPALPRVIPTKGFPRLIIDILGVELEFASVEEVEHFLDVVCQKNMPTSTQLTQKRQVVYGPNRHWLSRLPAKLKPWPKREKYIKTIEGGLCNLKLLYP